jgi:glycosyltransferase involved in cell wall biosynthesis
MSQSVRKYNIAIIIPALNEEATIGTVISGVEQFGDVIVVDDGSIDQTAKIAENSGAIVVRHDKNQGYDHALYTGFNYAIYHNYDICLSLDADNQHNPEFIPKLISPLLSGDADISIGTRPQAARITEFLFKYYVRLRFGINDILCGMKAYRIDVLKHYVDIFLLKTIGTGVVLAAARQGRRIHQLEMPVNFRADTPRLGRTVKANWVIGKAMFYDITKGSKYGAK